jgi:hypothetical protein
MRTDEYWLEVEPGTSFIVMKGEDEPFMGDDGHPYEISLQLNEDGSISSSIHDLEQDTYYPDSSLKGYIQEARQRWGCDGEAFSIPLRYPRGAIKCAQIRIMEEAPSERIQPPGWPFVACISFPPIDIGYIQYLVANKEGEVRDMNAWDDEGGVMASQEDGWQERPFDAWSFRAFVIRYARNTDPRNWVQAMLGRP